jgi:hypothetical protein
VSKAGCVRSVGRSPLDAHGRDDRPKRPGLSADQTVASPKNAFTEPRKDDRCGGPGRRQKASMTQSEVIILYPYKCLKFMSL